MPEFSPELPTDGNWRRLPTENGTVAWAHLAQDATGRWIVDGVYVCGQQVRSDDLRAVAVGEIERVANHAALSAALDDPGNAAALRRIRGEDPLAFAERVARQYRHFAALTRRPNVAMAEASGVPVSTVRAWVLEARRVGALPPGRQGRVG